MEFDYDFIVNELKFEVSGVCDSVFEKQYGIKYNIIELSGNGYSLSFDQITRLVSLYVNNNIVNVIKSVEELMMYVDIVKMDIESSQTLLIKKIIAGDAMFIHKLMSIYN